VDVTVDVVVSIVVVVVVIARKSSERSRPSTEPAIWSAAFAVDGEDEDEILGSAIEVDPCIFA